MRVYNLLIRYSLLMLFTNKDSILISSSKKKKDSCLNSTFLKVTFNERNEYTSSR